ncbi:MAG: DUF4173 domain-containing protein [Clostridia bacterium]|nr:DUF4173 domain-containing protein [Clostridia bacterium]
MNEEITIPENKKKESKYSFTSIDFFASLAALVLGYLFVCVLAGGADPLGTMIFVILLYLSSAVFIFCSKKRPDRLSLVLGAIGIAFSAGFIVSSAVRGWLFFGEMLLYIYFVYSAFGNRNEDKIGRLFWFDALKSATVMPFSSLDALFGALTSLKKDSVGKRAAKNILWVFLGLAAAIIPTAIIASLLDYDSSFGSLMSRISNAFDFSDTPIVIRNLIFAFPVAIYSFALFASSKFNLNRERYNVEECGRISEKARFLPTVLSVTAMLPILALYVIFFISQWGMYVSAFTGVLPENVSYAEYARQGFFELCSVCAINAALIFTVNAFTKKAGRLADITLRIIKAITAIFSIVLAATALSKMFLYIGAYGLTLKRVLASWLIILLLIVFVFVIISQITYRFRFNAALLIAFAILFGTLVFSDVPTIVAEYNTEAYLSGELLNIDANELYYECGEAGIPSLVLLSKSAPDEDIREYAKALIEQYKGEKAQEENNGERGFFSFSIIRAKAEKAVE